MKYDETKLLEMAVEITKEHSRGGIEQITPDILLEAVYNKLVEINDKFDDTDGVIMPK